jgi:hypothetical protein
MAYRTVPDAREEFVSIRDTLGQASPLRGDPPPRGRRGHLPRERPSVARVRLAPLDHAQPIPLSGPL